MDQLKHRQFIILIGHEARSKANKYLPQRVHFLLVVSEFIFGSSKKSYTKGQPTIIVRHERADQSFTLLGSAPGITNTGESSHIMAKSNEYPSRYKHGGCKIADSRHVLYLIERQRR